MTEKRPLFRPEAVEHHNRSRTGGRALDLRERRTVWLFRGLLGAIALAVVAAFTVRAEATARGPAVVGANGTTAVVATDLRRVREGQRVTLTIDGRPAHGAVESVGANGATVRLHDRYRVGATAEATIHVGTAPVAKMLLGWDD